MPAPVQPAGTPFYRPVWAEVDHAALRHNFRAIRRRARRGVQVLAVVKANAYGHGLVPVARTVAKCGAAFLGITSIEEALELKAVGIRTPALILGNIYPFSNLEIAIRNGVRVSVASLESAEQCARTAQRLGRPVFAHAKVDTGMGRIGVSAQNALTLIEKIHGSPAMVLEGVYTHFSSSAESPEFTRRQFASFTGLLDQIRSRRIRIPYAHCANSAAIFTDPRTHLSLIRPGLSLYGHCPVRNKGRELRPALSWKSRIIFVKSVPPQTPISYDRTFVTRRRSRIATAAFGYADGFRRLLSNRSWVLVRGRRAPVVGRITMDMTMLDVTGIPEVRVGDEVVLIGAQGRERISARELGVWAQTSPYEIFCQIAPRVPRLHGRTHG